MIMGCTADDGFILQRIFPRICDMQENILTSVYLITEDIYSGGVRLNEDCAVPTKGLGESVADQRHWRIVGYATCDDDLVTMCGVCIGVWNDRPKQLLGCDATFVGERCVHSEHFTFDLSA